MADQENNRIVTYEVGKSGEDELNARILGAWRKAIAKNKGAVAAALQVDEGELDPDVPPCKAEVSGSGLTGAEVIILFATAFAAGFVKDMGSAAGKAAAQRLRRFWEDVLEAEVNPPGTGELGDPKD